MFMKQEEIKMKKIIAMLLALVMVLGLVACASSATTEETTAPAETATTEATTEEATTEETTAPAEEASAAEGSVYWLNFKPESDEVLQNVAAMYTEKTGVPVTVVTAASGTYNETLTAEMDKSKMPTLFVVGNQAAVGTWGDYCYDLTGTAVANELNTDAYNLYDEDGKLCSIGYCYECYGIIVNPDLLEAAGHSLDEITNFETLKTVVEDIHARADELGFDAFTSCDMDSNSSWRFTGHMANLEYYYEQEGETWTQCPATLSGAYMDNFKNLYTLCINNSLTAPTDLAAGGHDASEEFRTGKAAFQVQGSWEWSGMAEQVPNAAMIPYYCGVEGEEKAGLNCGTENCWAVNSEASEEDIQATLDFMYWMVTDPEVSAILVESFGVMPYKNAAESTNAFLADANEYSNNGCYVMNWATNYQPNVDTYRDGLVAALNQFNADQSDANWELVKTAFVDGWAVQYQAVNG